jgi:hypothetical protein
MIPVWKDRSEKVPRYSLEAITRMIKVRGAMKVDRTIGGLVVDPNRTNPAIQVNHHEVLMLEVGAVDLVQLVIRVAEVNLLAGGRNSTTLIVVKTADPTSTSLMIPVWKDRSEKVPRYYLEAITRIKVRAVGLTLEGDTPTLLQHPRNVQGASDLKEVNLMHWIRLDEGSWNPSKEVSLMTKAVVRSDHFRLKSILRSLQAEKVTVSPNRLAEVAVRPFPQTRISNDPGVANVVLREWLDEPRNPLVIPLELAFRRVWGQ